MEIKKTEKYACNGEFSHFEYHDTDQGVQFFTLEDAIEAFNVALTAYCSVADITEERALRLFVRELTGKWGDDE